MITKEEILKGQSCPAEYQDNLKKLLEALNMFRAVYGKPMVVSSGYRIPEHNQLIGGAKNSAHCFCEAADFSDNSQSLRSYCLANLAILESCGLWMEDPAHTPTWVHLQIRPASKRIFTP
jgi:zinc D-Ala-D-Ala carboxypeptidase